MVGGWRLARSPRRPSIVKKSNPPRLFPDSYKVLKNQPTNCSPRTRCTAVRTAALLYSVCKGLVGGWVEGALRRPWWVRGPFRTWESFFVLWEINFFFVSKIPVSHWCLGVPPSPLLHSSVLYYRTYCCTAVLLPC